MTSKIKPALEVIKDHFYKHTAEKNKDITAAEIEEYWQQALKNKDTKSFEQLIIEVQKSAIKTTLELVGEQAFNLFKQKNPKQYALDLVNRPELEVK